MQPIQVRIQSVMARGNVKPIPVRPSQGDPDPSKLLLSVVVDWGRRERVLDSGSKLVLVGKVGLQQLGRPSAALNFLNDTLPLIARTAAMSTGASIRALRPVRSVSSRCAF